MYLTVAFIQMLKAGTPVVLMTMLSLSGVEYMSPQVAGSTLVMAFGTALTSMSAVNWHTLGFIMMMMSELAEAGRCVLTQYVLKVRGGPGMHTGGFRQVFGDGLSAGTVFHVLQSIVPPCIATRERNEFAAWARVSSAPCFGL